MLWNFLGVSNFSIKSNILFFGYTTTWLCAFKLLQRCKGFVFFVVSYSLYFTLAQQIAPLKKNLKESKQIALLKKSLKTFWPILLFGPIPLRTEKHIQIFIIEGYLENYWSESEKKKQ